MRVHPKLILTLASAVALTAVMLHGQTISEDEIKIGSRPYTPGASKALRVQTNLVEVGVVVRDARGKPIAGLRQDDFQILDEGKPQRISLFSVEVAPRVETTEATPIPNVPPAPTAAPAPPAGAPKPRYVALFFDDLSMPNGDLVSARKAAEQFVREDLEPGDKIGVFTSSTTVTLEFTEDRQKLAATLEQILNHYKKASRGSACQYLDVYQAYLIKNQGYDTRSDIMDLAMAECGGDPKEIYHYADETMSLVEHYSLETLGTLGDVINYLGKMPGKRMVVLTSSGFMTQTLHAQQDKILNAALQAKVVINSLDAKGLYAETPGSDWSDGPPFVHTPRPALMAFRDQLAHQQKQMFDDPMAMLADGTGGKFFHNSNDLGRGLREMAAVPEVSYVLGFSPDGMKVNGSFHTIKVKVPSQHDVEITARKGYFAPEPEKKSQPSSLTKMEEMDRQVLGAGVTSGIPVEVTAESGKLGSGEAALKVTVHVDVRNLPFTRRDNRHVDRLMFVTALFDSDGKFLTAEQQIMDLNLKDATLTQISGQGVTANLRLQAPPGSYRLREVVQEEASGRMASLSRAVEIH
jgi:VWFA-related protein